MINFEVGCLEIKAIDTTRLLLIMEADTIINSFSIGLLTMDYILINIFGKGLE